MGNRIAKYVYNGSELESSTFYVRDAQGTTGTPETNGSRHLGKRLYELSNHLGNVLTVISDRKMAVPMAGTSEVWYYRPHLVSVTDYSPFGVALTARTWSDQEYRYGFNGKELDNEGMGGGATTYDYGFRIYNASLGKFLSVDPLFESYPWYTPYQFAGNKPIWAIDLDGKEEWYVTIVTNEDKSKTITIVRNYDVQGSSHKSKRGTGEVIRGPRPETFQIVVNGEITFSDSYTGEEADWVNEMVRRGNASTASTRLTEMLMQSFAVKNIPVAKPPVKTPEVVPRPVVVRIPAPPVVIVPPPPRIVPPPTALPNLTKDLCFSCWWGIANSKDHWDKALNATIKWLDSNPDYKLEIWSNANATFSAAWSEEEIKKLNERYEIFIAKLNSKSGGKYGRNDIEVKQGTTATGTSLVFVSKRR